MFFSEKSHSPFPAIRSCVSSVAYAANAQHAPTCPWFLTGEIHPCSHEFHCAGSDVFDDERKRPVLREETSFCGAAPLVGGRKPVARGRSSADATSDSAQSAAVSTIPTIRPILIGNIIPHTDDMIIMTLEKILSEMTFTPPLHLTSKNAYTTKQKGKV